MSRMTRFLVALMAVVAAAVGLGTAPATAGIAAPTTVAKPLAGLVIAIDPGHQLGNSNPKFFAALNKTYFVGGTVPYKRHRNQQRFPRGYLQLRGRSVSASGAGPTRRNGRHDPVCEQLEHIRSVHPLPRPIRSCAARRAQDQHSCRRSGVVGARFLRHGAGSNQTNLCHSPGPYGAAVKATGNIGNHRHEASRSAAVELHCRRDDDL
jgi:hypothetical protein